MLKNASLASHIEKIETLFKYIEGEYILHSLYVLNSTIENIVDRMEQVTAAGIESPRPWMIMCSKERFDV